jgi:hypothetical protein
MEELRTTKQIILNLCDLVLSQFRWAYHVGAVYNGLAADRDRTFDNSERRGK